MVDLVSKSSPQRLVLRKGLRLSRKGSLRSECEDGVLEGRGIDDRYEE